ncbi:LapA family protein [Jeotgalibacillus marinus]|uniref:Lipopolysaccharide assembly protein LapA domain-containing protein n=1 Tax=Jeotgalibacillus marinus TaxID=86667 RepID=A0ABV3PZK7_9BACL
MRFQWALIMGIIFALIVAIFAVINVNPVIVNFAFAQVELPLILVILGSVLMGGLIIGSVGLFRLFVTQRKIKHLEVENENLNQQLAQSLVSEHRPLSTRKTAPDSTGKPSSPE